MTVTVAQYIATTDSQLDTVVITIMTDVDTATIMAIDAITQVVTTVDHTEVATEHTEEVASVSHTVDS